MTPRTGRLATRLLLPRTRLDGDELTPSIVTVDIMVVQVQAPVALYRRIRRGAVGQTLRHLWPLGLLILRQLYDHGL